jgi:hypothetical protein
MSEHGTASGSSPSLKDKLRFCLDPFSDLAGDLLCWLARNRLEEGCQAPSGWTCAAISGYAAGSSCILQ